MILSASRRTDIPNYYADWFLHRISEGFLYVRNPMNPHQISRIALSPEAVDCIVFWTKNPANMLDRLDVLRDYACYFQFTLTGYGRDVEPGLPDKKKALIPTFQRLSALVGKERVIWRYDPILLTKRYTAAYHVRAFAQIAEKLAPCTERVVISFVDSYAKIRKNLSALGARQPSGEEMLEIAAQMAQIASAHHLAIESCAEEIDLQAVGVSHGSCIDRALIERLTGCRLRGSKDRNQRAACGCLESVDVGSYDTCLNGCRYCYANDNDAKVRENVRIYDPCAPLLCSAVTAQDRITDRQVRTLKEHPGIAIPSESGYDKINQTLD